MLPVKFRVSYSDDRHYDYHQKGFTPIRNDDGEYIHAIHAEMSFHKWIGGGVYMQVILLEEVVPKNLDMLPFERKIYEVVVYDHPNPDDVSLIKPSVEQGLLMHALNSGDVRGDFANRTAGLLYADLVVLHPKSNFGIYLPEVKAWFEKNWR
jgi:hypothetical protein